MMLVLADHIRVPQSLAFLGILALGPLTLALTLTGGSARYGPGWFFRLGSVAFVVWVGVGLLTLLSPTGLTD